MRNWITATVAFSLLGLVQAQPAGISGPVSGFVFDPTGGVIRPVNGLPGAWLLGNPVDLPLRVDVAGIASGNAFAVLVDSAGDTVLIRGLRDERPQVIPLDGVAPASRVVVNQSESAVLLYSAEHHTAQLVDGLPDQPRVRTVADLSGLGGEVTAMALGSGAAWAIVGTRALDRGAIYLVPLDGQSEPRFLAPARWPSAIALGRRDLDAVVADRSDARIFALRNFQTAGTVTDLAGEQDGVNEPVGLQFFDQAQKFVVTNAGDNSVFVFDLTTNSSSYRVQLSVTPSRCESFGTSSVLALNEAGNGPLFLLDLRRDPQLLFIPADSQ